MSENKWIPVSERMPDNQADVLIAVKWYEQPAIAHYSEQAKCWFESSEHSEVRGDAWVKNDIAASAVTHWMPLPLMPEGHK